MIAITISDSNGHNHAYVATEQGLRILMQHLIEREDFNTTLEQEEVQVLEEALTKTLSMDEMVAVLQPIVNRRHSEIYIGELGEYTEESHGWWL